MWSISLAPHVIEVIDMAENRHTMNDLYQMQSLPLSAKLRMTEFRIRQWIEEFGRDGVYVSFSGGKDSTVLLDIIRNRMDYKDIPAVFVDVPTQYPELKQFALTWDNVEVLKPEISFMEVCEKYGFPLISKEVADTVCEAKKYFTRVIDENKLQTDRQTGSWAVADILGVPRRGDAKENPDYLNLKNGIIPDYDDIYEYLKQNDIKTNVRVDILYGRLLHKENGIVTNEYIKQYDKSKYKFMLYSPFEVSGQCCRIMKKKPLKEYAKRTNRMPITAQMASESKLRTSQWIKYGCNMFDATHPISNPMSFWTEQDILLYIKEHNLPICSVYGDVVPDWDKTDDVEGQMTISDLEGFNNMELFDAERPPLKTTGCKRTGCMLCGFGCHLNHDDRFLQLKETHPKMYALLDVIKNNGITMREAIEWLNEHGNLDIRL